MSTVSLTPEVLPNGGRKFDIQLNDKDAHAIPYAGVPIVAKVVPVHKTKGIEEKR